MVYFTYLRSCKGNPKVMTVVITRGLGGFLSEPPYLGADTNKHVLDQYTDVIFFPFHLFFLFLFFGLT